MLVVAARRFAYALGIVSAAALVAAMLGSLLTGAALSRSISLAFYLSGAALVLIGFFLGNRGPLRAVQRGNERAKGRDVHWATPDERSETLNDSAIWVTLGFVLLALGILSDGRHPLF